MADLREIVIRKRDGETLSDEEIAKIVLGYARGEVSDELAASFLMAAFTRGLDLGETVAMTRARVESGTTLGLEGITTPTVDKHSTGGVADGVTLVFVPLVASLGIAAAKLSGRGLGHTGGTLDKLESIPGFRTNLTPVELTHQVDEVGCAIAAQTKELVPADGKLYALRDATGSVESLPMIAASVMSKKLAVQTDLILLDVKTGGGAFMKTREDATRLAEMCLAIAREWDRACIAAVTDMSQPLGDAIGNALDVKEAIAVLRGESGGRLTELTIEMAVSAQRKLLDVPNAEARTRAEASLSSGEALDRFRRMVEAQGGDPRVVEEPDSVLPSAAVVSPIRSPKPGVLAAVDAEALGRAAGELGAGRKRKEDPIDPSVGIVLHAKMGDRLEGGEEIGEVHARDQDAAELATRRVLEAMSLTDSPVEAPPLVYGWHGD